MPPRTKAPGRTTASAAKRSAPARKAAEKLKRVTAAARIDLYSARQYLDSSTLDELTVSIPFDVYFQDPAVREATKAYNFDETFTVPWEPGISDGPTSARFVVIDYDGTTEALNRPAKWDKKDNVFRDDNGVILDRNNLDTPQSHQVNVWATLQSALNFYESGAGLGRRISWGFEGNRLIVVPHAGYGENAYYDRDSKSLQFYYFDYNGDRVHTCLSADIINHEFGHAVLDGVRPLYRESVFVETAAFHEFVGDISAILIAFRNSKLRRQIGEVTNGDLDKDSALSSLAEQFGRKDEKPYLRTALNKLKYKEVNDSPSHHHMSQVLTGVMFDILREVYRYNRTKREHSVPQSLWFTASRMQNLAIQALDLLPPVDVTFADYAEAVLRAEQIVNPTDPDGYRGMMLKAFGKRGILEPKRIKKLADESSVLAPVEMRVFHEARDIASSPANAYRFLDDNRRQLLIPYGADLVVSDLSTAVKFTTRRRRQAKHILLQYVWREDVPLAGKQFGQFDGQTTDLLCGATLALDIDGNLLAWARKPGILPLMRSPTGRGKKGDAEVDAEAEAGVRRREAFLTALAARIQAGSVGGVPVSGALGLLQKSIAPLSSYVVNGTVRFGLAPHVGISNHSEDENNAMGDRSWSISS
ncbi:M36 family metallopeptidase [Bosea sp. ASV33]|uniref:M36 family metallopeptidase n=1 Tax=Bosea sp. ASV33 TaxID=2795106 RepID=UPI0018EE18C6|nr:M36 family metallopeptidase [Bosea sp. ASV33]